MKERYADLVYSIRNLCEILRERIDSFDKDDELRDYLEETENCLSEIDATEDD